MYDANVIHQAAREKKQEIIYGKKEGETLSRKKLCRFYHLYDLHAIHRTVLGGWME